LKEFYFSSQSKRCRLVYNELSSLHNKLSDGEES
jgi:hypothetical protein